MPRDSISGADDPVDFHARDTALGNAWVKPAVNERHAVDDLDQVPWSHPATEHGVVFEQFVLALAKDAGDAEVLLVRYLIVALEVLDLVVPDDVVHVATASTRGLLDLVDGPEHVSGRRAAIDEIADEHQMPIPKGPVQRIVSNAMAAAGTFDKTPPYQE